MGNAKTDLKMKKSTEFRSRKKSLYSMVLYQKLSNIRVFQTHMKDELALLLHLSFKPIQSKFIFLLIIYVACQFSFALCLTTYRLLSAFDKRTLLKHGSFGGIDIFILINLWTIVFKFRTLMSFVTSFRQGALPINKDVLGEKKYNDITYKVKLVKIIVIINYSLAIAAAFGFTLSQEYFNSRSYMAVCIRNSFRDYSEYILFLVHLSNFPVALVLVSLSTALSYCSFGAVFQLIIINRAVEGICQADIPPAQRYSSETYQMMVCQKLKICVMWHQHYVRLASFSSEMLYIPIIFFSMGAVILGASLLLEFLTNDATQMSNQYFGIVCFSAAGVISANLYISSCQLLKNESERTHYLLCHLPWYYMNKENKQIYSIFLSGAGIPISLMTPLIEVNFLLHVRIFKAIYSIAAVLAQLVTTTSSGHQL